MEEDGGPYLSSSAIRATFAVCNNTLCSLADKGAVRVVRIGKGGKRLYSAPDVKRVLGCKQHTTVAGGKPRAKIAYARVSSKKQEPDLERQKEALARELGPGYEIVSDVGSGINFRRRGLLAVLDRALEGTVQEVVVARRDRLCRFAFDLLEHTLERCGCKVRVLDSSVSGSSSSSSSISDSGDAERELADDLLAITTVFVASHNGRRAAANRRARKEAAEKQAAEGKEGEERGKGGEGDEDAEMGDQAECGAESGDENLVPFDKDDL